MNKYWGSGSTAP